MKLNYDFIMAVETIEFLAKNKGKDYIQAEKIAEALDYSLGYLQKTMQLLSKQGLIECKRGRIGGAKIGKKKITMLDVWNVTCGQIDAELTVPELAKPLKAFADALSKVVVYK